MRRQHRKRKVVYNEPGHAHFVTFSCQDRFPLLSKDRSRRWFVEALAEARLKGDFDLWAWVVMPEHVHLLLRPRRREYKMGHILAAIKRPVSVKAKAHLEATGNREWLARLTVKEGDKEVFRFWLPGGGYDENLTQERPVLEVAEYTHANPVRRGLVSRATDWEYSSARFYAGDPSALLAMDPIY